MHLAELPKPDVLNSILPGLGHDWTEIIISLSVVYYRTASYALEWEAVAARWAADDHTLLQPAEPCWLTPLLYASNMLKQTVAKKELELCGGPLVSSAPRVVVQHGEYARADGHAAATRRLGVTSGTGAMGGAIYAAGGAKEPAAEDEQT